MKSSHVKNFFDEVKNIANNIDKKDIENLAKEIRVIQKNKGRIFFLGIGGSASNSSHAVNDFRKLCNIESYAPTDVSELTARLMMKVGMRHYQWLKVSKLNKSDAILTVE